MLATCNADLRPWVHQNNDVWLPLAAFVITACYAEKKPGVRIVAADGNLRSRDLKMTGQIGRRFRTLALKRRGGTGAALWIHQLSPAPSAQHT